MVKEEKIKALDAALANIEKQFGKGSVMKLGESNYNQIGRASCRERV